MEWTMQEIQFNFLISQWDNLEQGNEEDDAKCKSFAL